MEEGINEWVVSCRTAIPSKTKKVFWSVCSSPRSPEHHASLSPCLLSKGPEPSLRWGFPVVCYYGQCPPLAAPRLFTLPVGIYGLSRNQKTHLPSVIQKVKALRQGQKGSLICKGLEFVCINRQNPLWLGLISD